MIRIGALAALLFAASAQAGVRGDYVREWPLLLGRDDGGAFRVALTYDVYATAQDANLGDIEVFNANGDPVPAAVLPAGTNVERGGAPLTVELRWFPLPAPADDVSARWNLRAERDANGRVARVEVDIPDAQRDASPRRELLLDLSQLRSPLAALRFEWKAPGAAANAAYRIDRSENLDDWRATGITFSLVDLANDTATLRQDRVALDGTYGPYLRLVPQSSTTPLDIVRVVAELAPPPAEPVWTWTNLAGRRVEDRGRTHFEYGLDARLPVERIDLAPAAGNSAGEWTVQSRDDDRRAWQHRAGPWMAYAVSAGDTVERSTSQSLASKTRDRAWRADSAQAGMAPPLLRVGWRAEELVFLAQGPEPYTLAAGSVKARRADAPIARLLAELRNRRGADWQPYPVILGDARSLAGKAALVAPAPPPKPVAWTSWVLWALLVGGAALVAAMALHLLREPPAKPERE